MKYLEELRKTALTRRTQSDARRALVSALVSGCPISTIFSAISEELQQLSQRPDPVDPDDDPGWNARRLIRDAGDLALWIERGYVATGATDYSARETAVQLMSLARDREVACTFLSYVLRIHKKVLPGSLEGDDHEKSFQRCVAEVAFISDLIEKATKSFLKDPKEDDLRKIVLSLSNTGYSQEQAVLVFECVLDRLIEIEDADESPAIEAALDVYEGVCGWCAREYRLWPSDNE